MRPPVNSRPGWAILISLLLTVGLYALAFSSEAGVGSLRGRVVAADTGLPLPKMRVVIRPSDPQSGSDARSVHTDAQGYFAIRAIPAGAYEVVTTASVYRNTPQNVSVLEGKTAAPVLSLAPGGPSLDLYIHRHANLPEDEPRAAIHGFKQGDALSVRLYSVDPNTLLDGHGSELRKLLQPVSRTGSPGTFRALQGGKLKLVREWAHRIKRRDAEGVFYENLEIGKLPSGVYLLSAHGAKNDALGWLMVTDLALVTKSVRGNLVAFTTHLKTGEPIPNAELTLYRGGNRLLRQNTDAQGLLRATLNTANNEEVSAVARRGQSVAFMNVSPFGDGDTDRFRVFTYTDRPVYRPGHRVRFKGIARVLRGSGYALPEAGSVQVRVLDDQETEIWSGHPNLNERGTFAGEFDLPSEAHSGPYSIETRIAGERHTDEFTVASYRKPEWKVEVKPEKSSYVRGDQVPVNIRAEYFYGEPVVNGTVRYTVYRAPYWSWRDPDEDADDSDTDDGASGYSGDVVAQGTLTTNNDGSARLTFPTDKEPDREWSRFAGSVQQYQYTVHAEVADLSNRSVSGSGSVRVANGALTLDAVPSRYVAQPGSTVNVDGTVKDLDGKPVANAEVTATTSLDIWAGNRFTTQTLRTETLRTDDAGKVRLALSARETGDVTVKLSSRDARGNTVAATTNIWVTSADGGDYATNAPALSIIPDKKHYRVGDTAQILLNTDKPGSVALVSMEAEQIHELKQVRLSRRSTVVRFPIRAGYEPDVYLSACFVRNREFIVNRARIRVNPEMHRLKVTVTADREQYHPGDMATFTVHTATAAGQPAPAEVSLGVVDEAVYAIKEEPKRGAWEAFYPRRYDQVRTEFSFPQIYLGDADKDGANIQIRKEFPDTAFWNPTVMTDRTGTATVRLKLPDSLTSWRATAVALNAQTSVGKAVHNIRVAKELTLRLQLPRHLTEGDRLQLSAVAHNYSGSPQDVDVNLRVDGLKLNGDTHRRVHVNTGAAERVTWDAIADTPGRATVTATATAGALSDGVQLNVGVKPFARETVYYHTGTADDASATEEFDLQGAAISGDLDLRLSPTLAASMLSGLEYLATYPHGCTEQTMSSFLPDVMISRTIGGLGIRQPALENRLPEMTRAGLLRLYGYQHQDGGWGWWEYDETDPWMTAYVLFGLTVAKEAGVSVNQRIYENGLRAAGELVKKDKLLAENGMLLAYALARAGKPDDAHALLSRFPNGKLSRRALAYRILALTSLNGSEDRQAAISLMTDLWAAAQESGGVIHWTAPRSDHAEIEAPGDAEVTGLVLKAAMQTTPDDARLPGVVRWLLLARKGDKWESTRDTAWILFGLADYLKKSGDLKPDYHVSVLLNGREIYANDVKPGEAVQPETIIHATKKDLQPRNKMEIRRSGTGNVYYTLEWKQQVAAPGMAAESGPSGFTVSREYYRLETRKDEAGHISVVPERNPTTSYRVGDRIMAQVKIHTDAPLEFLMLEDPLPAGWEVQDRGALGQDEWTFWWCHMDVRDDRVNTFIRHLDPGTHVVQYYLRPEASGKIRVLPAVVGDMYTPSTRCSSAENRLEVGQ